MPRQAQRTAPENGEKAAVALPQHQILWYSSRVSPVSARYRARDLLT